MDSRSRKTTTTTEGIKMTDANSRFEHLAVGTKFETNRTRSEVVYKDGHFKFVKDEESKRPFWSDDQGPLAIVGAPGVGRRTLARNMAQAAQDAGEKVYLIDDFGTQDPHETVRLVTRQAFRRRVDGHREKLEKAFVVISAIPSFPRNLLGKNTYFPYEHSIKVLVSMVSRVIIVGDSASSIPMINRMKSLLSLVVDDGSIPEWENPTVQAELRTEDGANDPFYVPELDQYI